MINYTKLLACEMTKEMTKVFKLARGLLTVASRKLPPYITLLRHLASPHSRIHIITYYTIYIVKQVKLIFSHSKSVLGFH